MALVEERQKIIRLADRSEYAWDFVQEYQSDELAADSDDEKKISKAEKAAEHKLQKKKKVGAVGKGNKTRYEWRPRAASSSPASGLPQSWSGNFTSPCFAPGPVHPRASSRTISPCFSCGEFGHLRSMCSKMTPATPKYTHNLYSSNADENVDLTFEFSLGREELVCERNNRYWEYGEQVEICVKGRLRNCREYWEKVIQAPVPILKLILPFVSLPEGKWLPNQRSAIDATQFVTMIYVLMVVLRGW